MATDAKPALSIHNTGSRRVILGPPAKSKGGGSPVLLGTPDDAKAAAKASPGTVPSQTATLQGDAAEIWRKSKVLAAAKEHLGLKVT